MKANGSIPRRSKPEDQRGGTYIYPLPISQLDGAVVAANSETLACGNQTRGHPTSLSSLGQANRTGRVWPRPRDAVKPQRRGWSRWGRGSLSAAEKPIQTYQEMHRTPRKCVFTKQGGTQTFLVTHRGCLTYSVKIWTLEADHAARLLAHPQACG